MTLIECFKNDCLKIEPEIIVQKYLLEGSSYFFDKEAILDEFQFKKDISLSLGVHIRDIVIVGSGKLGFSIKPDKVEPGYFPFKTFDQVKRSDLDIAIVSNKLFDDQLVRLYEHTSQYINKEIWKEKGDRNALAKYILKGWLKPDFIPKEFKFSDNIQEELTKYKMKFGRDVNIGIYKSWYFFENYHINNIRNINLNLIANG
ncbi:hypothetical protein [Polaribacter sp. 20A6]|uniref:hypothetical protein n=1 Tax=Polaribacter sp. 20A6 TaxID=2687289 RepID=UPI0013FE456D|nr:hypothetical protein [Polaribacter sp. 20A6]